ncbi:MAG: RNA methyltransferase [Candidatus Latescibacteria bacterium]|nr:RNA methyltransferase [Candidatus Latescibacterota bacterium]
MKRFYIEGGKLLWEALDSEASFERILWCHDLLRSPAEEQLLRRAVHSGIVCSEVGRNVFESLSEWDEPEGLGAVLVQRPYRLEEVPLTGQPLVVMVDSLQDPGNLGTIIRTADGVGAAGVLLIGPCVDLYNPKTLRATMGSFFALPVVECDDETAPLRWLKDRGMQVIAGTPKAAALYCEVDYRPSTCFVIGNEAHGIRETIFPYVDASVRVPIFGKADSLNAAVAGAVLLYEAVRQRMMDKREKGTPDERSTSLYR